MDIQDALAFVKENSRAVLGTRRREGTPQLSPVIVGVDDDGRLMVSSRETAFKVRNLRRDPSAYLCVMSDAFFGQWVQIDGRAEIVSLPEAMDLLVDYYRRLSGEHEDWDDYRSAMEREKRVMVLIAPDRAGPDRQG
jgi:PPOX class probable F420-dependent enzyme